MIYKNNRNQIIKSGVERFDKMKMQLGPRDRVKYHGDVAQKKLTRQGSGESFWLN